MIFGRPLLIGGIMMLLVMRSSSYSEKKAPGLT